MIAMGAIKAALECGLKIPDDMSVIGCGAIEMAKYFDPAKTRIRQNMAQIAQTAGKY